MASRRALFSLLGCLVVFCSSSSTWCCALDLARRDTPAAAAAAAATDRGHMPEKRNPTAVARTATGQGSHGVAASSGGSSGSGTAGSTNGGSTGEVNGGSRTPSGGVPLLTNGGGGAAARRHNGASGTGGSGLPSALAASFVSAWAIALHSTCRLENKITD